MSKKGRGRRGHGEGTVFQRQDGRWQGQADLGWENGKRKRVTVYDRTERGCIQKLREAQRRHEEGKPPTDSSQSLKQYLAWWLTNEVDPSELAIRTKVSYRDEVEMHIVPALGHHKLSALRSHHVAEWLAKMAKEAKKNEKGTPSANTRRLRHATLRRALNRAVAHGLIAANPAATVSGPRPVRDDAKVHTLTLDEARALVTAAGKNRQRAAWLIFLLMGLRRGEVLGLRWRDLDLRIAEMRVNQTLDRVKGVGLVFGPPKSEHSRRPLPIPPVVLDALQTHWASQEVERAEAGDWPESDLVFVTKNGKPIEPSNMNRQFHTLCKKAGLPPERIHNLRHTAGTVMRVHGGADLYEVSRLLGHSSVRVTGDLYGHTVAEAQQRIAGRMSDLFGLPPTQGEPASPDVSEIER